MNKTEAIEELTIGMKTVLAHMNRACEDEVVNHNRYIDVAIQRIQLALRRTRT